MLKARLGYRCLGRVIDDAAGGALPERRRHINAAAPHISPAGAGQQFLFFARSLPLGLSELFPDDRQRREEGHAVRDRPCKQDPVDPKKQRQDEYQRNQENYLSCERDEYAVLRLSDGRGKSRGQRHQKAKEKQGEVDPEVPYAEGEIFSRAVPEERYYLPREDQEQRARGNCNGRACGDRQAVDLANAVVLTRAVVEAGDGLHALRDPDNK